MTKSNFVHVGTFSSPIGIKGEIKVNIFVSSFEFFKKLNVYVNENDSISWSFNKMRLANNKLIVLPQGCFCRNDAKKLQGKKIFTPSGIFPKTRKNEYYVRDLIGCSIYMMNGNKIGNVISVNNFGADDLLEVKINNKKIYIPMNKDNLISIHKHLNKIIVNPIKGIID